MPREICTKYHTELIRKVQLIVGLNFHRDDMANKFRFLSYPCSLLPVHLDKPLEHVAFSGDGKGDHKHFDNQVSLYEYIFRYGMC